MLNQINLIGRLGTDPETREVGGSTVCTFSLATTEKWKDKSTGDKKEATQWHRITFWGAQAEVIKKYVSKGQMLFVSGQMMYEKYTDRDGVERIMAKVKGRSFSFLPQGEKQGNAGGGGNNGATAPQGNDGDMDDVPF